MRSDDIGLGFTVRLVGESEKGAQLRTHLMGAVQKAPVYKFEPEYSVIEDGEELVVSVLAGASLGQRRFDRLAISEARHMTEYAINKTIADTVAFETKRIAQQEVLEHGED